MEQAGIETEQTQVSQEEELTNLQTQEEQGNEELQGDEPKGEKSGELPKGVERRLRALTRQKHELQQQLEEIKAGLNKPSQELKREDYTEAEWVKIQVQEALKAERQALRAEAEAEKAEAKRSEILQNQMKEYKEIIPDFDDVMAEVNDIEVPNSAVQFIRDSDLATLLTYHVAKHEEVQDKLLELAQRDKSGRSVERYLSKIEAKLEAEMESRQKPKSKEITKAPPPAGKITAPQGSAVKNTDPLKMSTSEYRKWKAQGGLKNLR